MPARPTGNPLASASSRAALALLLREHLRARRARDTILDGPMFADPAWDILLDLLLAELERIPVSISSACVAASVPPTTALRWINLLEENRAIVRRRDWRDRRRTYLRLTEATRDRLLDWCERYLMPEAAEPELGARGTD